MPGEVVRPGGAAKAAAKQFEEFEDGCAVFAALLWRSGRQGHFIASHFAVRPHPGEREAKGGVVPMHRLEQPEEPVGQHVPPLEMGQLVEQHQPQLAAGELLEDLRAG